MRRAMGCIPAVLWVLLPAVAGATPPGGDGGDTPGAPDRRQPATLAPGAAAGEFRVAGQAVRLAHARVVFRREFPGDPETRTVVLSDVALADDVLLDDFGLDRLAREGAVHAVEVEVKADGTPGSGRLHHRAFAGEGPGGGTASLSVSGMHRFDPVAPRGDEVAGRLSMAEPDDFMGVTYHYDAAFRALPVRRPPPTAEGAAAPRSGPGRAVAAFLKAARAGDRAALRRTVEPALAAQLDGPDGRAMAAMLRSSLPAGLQIVEVTERGDAADVVVMKKGRDGRESLKLRAVRRDGAWKVGMGPGGGEMPPPRPPPTPEQQAAARTGPGKALLAFAEALRSGDLKRMKALSADPARFRDLEGPLGGMMLQMLAAAFPYDLRVTRVVEEGDSAVVEAESQLVPGPLTVRAVRVRGKWRIADEPPAEAPGQGAEAPPPPAAEPPRP